LSENEVTTQFSLSDPLRCGIETYELFDQNDQLIPASDPLYAALDIAARTSSAINIDTTIPPQDGTVTEILKDFKIKASAKGGATESKEVQVKFVICSDEVVAIDDDMRIVYEFHWLEPQDVNPWSFSIASNFTTSDSDCPANTFEITMDE